MASIFICSTSQRLALVNEKLLANEINGTT